MPYAKGPERKKGGLRAANEAARARERTRWQGNGV